MKKVKVHRNRPESERHTKWMSIARRKRRKNRKTKKGLAAGRMSGGGGWREGRSCCLEAEASPPRTSIERLIQRRNIQNRGSQTVFLSFLSLVFFPFLLPCVYPADH
jgi:hypothetical protein